MIEKIYKVHERPFFDHKLNTPENDWKTLEIGKNSFDVLFLDVLFPLNATI
jgi:hypothetical protein